MYNRKIIEQDCEELYERARPTIEKFKNKKILITGANGLLGGFFADFFTFLNEKHQFNLKIYLTSLSSADDAVRIKHIIEKKSFVKYYQWDMSNAFPKNVFDDADYIFFMSGYGQPKKFIKNKLGTIFLNTVGLNSLLEICSANNGNFLFASSSEIYGDPSGEIVQMDETYNGNYSVESNRACYISSKRLGEVICHEHVKSNPKMNVYIARVALAYGPGVLQSDDRVLQDFILKGYKNRKIQLLDDGSSVRNYLYITDCAEMLINIMLYGKQTTYNVGGTSEEITILELAKIVGKELNVEVLKGDTVSDFVKAAPKRVSLSMQRYVNEFGNVDKFINLTKGISNVVTWYGLKEEQ